MYELTNSILFVRERVHPGPGKRQMMKPRWISLLISSAILFASRGEGYELHTHVRLSQHAFDAATALGFYLADLELTTNQAFDPDGTARQSTAFANFDN